MRRFAGVVLLVVGMFAGAAGAFWGYMKAAGAEVDVCRGGSCTSGWVVVAAFGVVAVVAAGVALRLLRPR